MTFREYLTHLMNLEIEAEDEGIDLDKLQVAGYLLGGDGPFAGVIMTPERPYIDGGHLCLDYKRSE